MSNITRRRFLEDSLIASATAAAAAAGVTTMVSPFPVFAQTAANDKLGIMVVGCGRNEREADCFMAILGQDGK